MAHSFDFPLAPGKQPDRLPIGRDKPWLAPLAGYSDLPFRNLCREYGAACCVTEMVSAKGLAYNGTNTWRVLATVPEDTPLVVQLFGAEAPFLAGAVRTLREAGYSFFDLNMGCSVPKVSRQGAGSAMFRDLENAAACAKAMIEAAEPGHMSFKLRLGLNEENKPWLDFALRLEDMGAGLITLHPRTAKQGFGGEARWEELARAKEKLSIPVLASGDLFTAGDGVRCLEQTGVDGVMYARGALTNPAIFAEHIALVEGRNVPARSKADLKAMISRHVALISATGDEENVVFRLRSIVPRYVRTLPGIRRLRQELCHCTSLAGLDALLEEFLGGEEDVAEVLTDARSIALSSGSACAGQPAAGEQTKA